MSDGIAFELYQDSDAEQVAELLNRNKFHTARHKKVTPEDYRFTLRSRGYHFIVLAKKNGKVIAMAGVYPSSDQHVAKKHQVFLGSFLIDNLYRLSYSIVMGLFDMLMRNLMETDYKEILSSVRPENQGSYNLMLKCGFVLLSSEPQDFGRYALHCFSPAFLLYAGADAVEVSSKNFFEALPVVDRREARKFLAKPRLHGKYIECDYKLDSADVTLLFDIENAKIDGAIVPKHVKVYPDFDSPGQYIIENLRKSDPFHTSIRLIMEPTSGLTDIHYDITLEPGEKEIITCDKEVKEFTCMHAEQWYRFHPNLILETKEPKEPIRLESGTCGTLTPILDPSTGFLTIWENEEKLVTLPWPCAVYPYLEGLFTPRIKDLLVEPLENGIMVTEETDTCRLIRKYIFSEDTSTPSKGMKMTVATSMHFKSEHLNVRPIAQVYANKGVQGYTLTTGAKEMAFDASKIKHQGYEYSDYTYWDTESELFADSPLEKFSLLYKSAVVDVVIDKTCKPIVHAPVFTSTLAFDKEKLLEEQVIEELEVYYRMEEI